MKDQDLEALLQDLSVEEKVYQLIQYQGANYSDDAVLTGLLDQNHITPHELGMAGSTLCIWGADKLKKIQSEIRAHREKFSQEITEQHTQEEANG